jgi:hypothetical protein
MPSVLLVLIGLLVCAAALWTVDPLYALIPGVLIAGFGLFIDEGDE